MTSKLAITRRAALAIAASATTEGANRRINLLFALCMIVVGVWMLIPALTG